MHNSKYNRNQQHSDNRYSQSEQKRKTDVINDTSGADNMANHTNMVETIIKSYENFPSPVFIFDKKGTIVFMNDEHEKITGIESSLLVGNYNLYEDTQLFGSPLIEAFERALKGESMNLPPIKYDLTLLTSDHERLKTPDYWVAIQSYPIYGNNRNEVEFVVAINTQVENTTIENEIRKEKEKLYKVITKHIPNSAIAIVDKKHRILIADGEVIRKRIAYPDFLIGKPISTVLGREIGQYIDDNIEEAFMGELREEEHIYDDRIYRISYVPLHNEANDIYNVLVTAIDITQLKTAQQKLTDYANELQKLSKSKDKFFSIVAHDLRNPFVGLLGFTEMLVYDIEENRMQDVKQHSELIHESATFLYNLLENFLNWSRIQSGRMEFNPVKIDIKDLIYKVKGIFASSAENKRISLNCECNTNMKVIGDYFMIETVLRNLVSNAIKFTDNGGKVIITGVEDDDYLNVSVKDNGVGMDKETLESIFELGEKISTEGTQHETGSGLGLLLCKEYIDIHEYPMNVKSEVNKGTEFTIRFRKAIRME